MIPIGVAGLAFQLVNLYIGSNLNMLVPLFIVYTSIWGQLLIETWKRRENELAFSYGARNNSFNKIQRRDYEGDYIVDDVTHSVKKFNRFTPTQRRFLVRLPITVD